MSENDGRPAEEPAEGPPLGGAPQIFWRVDGARDPAGNPVVALTLTLSFQPEAAGELARALEAYHRAAGKGSRLVIAGGVTPDVDRALRRRIERGGDGATGRG